MAPSKNIKSYELEIQLLTQALEAPNRGIEVQVPDGIKLTTFKHRLNSARVADRLRSAEMYPVGDPLHGRSLFDSLIIRLSADKQRIVIERPIPGNFLVKEI